MPQRSTDPDVMPVEPVLGHKGRVQKTRFEYLRQWLCPHPRDIFQTCHKQTRICTSRNLEVCVVKTYVATVANRWELGTASKLINTTWCITVHVSQNDLVHLRVDCLVNTVGDVHSPKVRLPKIPRSPSPSLSVL